MTRRTSKRLRRVLLVLIVLLSAFLWSAWQTHVYPANRPVPSEVGVVPGASTWKNEPSPVYRERPGIRTRFLLREAYFWWQFQLVERFLPRANG